MQKPIEIHNHEIKPGTRQVLMLPMPKLYDWTPMAMPVHVIHGKETGPTLCLTAAVHGDEINGIEIIRRLLKKKIMKSIHGTLIAIPIVNGYGFLYQNRYLMDRRDLNRAFPGSQRGSLAARIAYVLSSEIISKATHVVDLHTGSLHRSNFPQIRTNLDSEYNKNLAELFGAPVVIHAKERDGSLRQFANEKSIPCLLYEGGEALRFDEISIRTGVRGVLNIMAEIGMIKPTNTTKKRAFPALTRSSYWVRATYSGILHTPKILGKKVHEGETLALIANPTSNEEHKLESPLSGIIIGKTNLPLVHAGAALFHIATFEELKDVEKQIEVLRDYYDDTEIST